MIVLLSFAFDVAIYTLMLLPVGTATRWLCSRTRIVPLRLAIGLALPAVAALLIHAGHELMWASFQFWYVRFILGGIYGVVRSKRELPVV